MSKTWNVKKYTALVAGEWVVLWRTVNKTHLPPKQVNITPKLYLVHLLTEKESL